MINGIIKLFYSEIVKTNMKKMPSSEYELREECKEIRNITLKIDSILLKIIKLITGFILLWLGFSINTLLGFGILSIELTYIVYKIKLEREVKEKIEYVKSNIEIPKVNIESDKSRAGLNGLATLLLIGLVTGFNIIIVSCFIILLIFTIKDIYSNIK